MTTSTGRIDQPRRAPASASLPVWRIGIAGGLTGPRVGQPSRAATRSETVCDQTLSTGNTAFLSELAERVVTP